MRSIITAAAVIVAVIVSGGCSSGTAVKTVNNIQVEGDCTAADVAFFDSFYTAMIQAVRTEDVDKSLSFYADGFKGLTDESMAGLRKNVAVLYANYRELVYSPDSIRLTARGSEAVTTDQYSYNAVPEDSRKFKPLNYSGRERIYWKKEDGAWKIMDWIYY